MIESLLTNLYIRAKSIQITVLSSENSKISPNFSNFRAKSGRVGPKLRVSGRVGSGHFIKIRASGRPKIARVGSGFRVGPDPTCPYFLIFNH